MCGTISGCDDEDDPAALSCPSAALFTFRKALEQHSEAPSLKNQHQPNASSVNVSPKCFSSAPSRVFFYSSAPSCLLRAGGGLPRSFGAFGNERFAYYGGLQELSSVTYCAIFT